MNEREPAEEKPPIEADPLVPDEDALPMPGWVPILIGGILVAIAGLAVYTGVNYRHDTLARTVKPRRMQTAGAAAAPGEPQPGASLVYPGDSGEAAPQAHPAPAGGHSRVMIEGTPGGITATVRVFARRGFILDVKPPDALVYVNDVLIGQARQFASTDGVYDFPAPGSYTVRLTAPGFREKVVVVTSAESAKQELARISASLEKDSGVQ